MNNGWQCLAAWWLVEVSTHLKNIIAVVKLDHSPKSGVKRKHIWKLKPPTQLEVSRFFFWWRNWQNGLWGYLGTCSGLLFFSLSRRMRVPRAGSIEFFDSLPLVVRKASGVCTNLCAVHMHIAKPLDLLGDGRSVPKLHTTGADLCVKLLQENHGHCTA